MALRVPIRRQGPGRYQAAGRPDATYSTLTAEPALTRRVGFEIELLAPEGGDRRQLANEIARRHGGEVRPVFHTDSEPSLVPGMGHFWHLTPGFAVYRDETLLATLVDDVTINADLRPHRDRGTPAAAGWYRLLSDDPRLLRLIDRHSDPATPFAHTLESVAALFGASVETIGTARRLRDTGEATIALAAPLPSGRERPCEIVTAPLSSDHEAALEALLTPARELGFTVPKEAAVHLHVDGDPFRNVGAFANLVRLFGGWRTALWTALATNPACIRLNPLPEALRDLVEQPCTSPGGTAAWPALQEAAAATGLTKYFDVNLTALLVDRPARDTVEVRILPGALHASEIIQRAALIDALLDRCCRDQPIPPPRATDPTGLVVELQTLASEG